MPTTAIGCRTAASSSELTKKLTRLAFSVHGGRVWVQRGASGIRTNRNVVRHTLAESRTDRLCGWEKP